MFGALGRFVVRNPVKVILAWVVVSVAVVAFSPRLTDIINADQTSFLPDSYESVQAQELAETAFPQASGATVIGVVKRADGAPLTDADTQRVQQLAERLSGAGIERVVAAQTAPQAVSPNRAVQLVTVALQGTPQDEAVVEALREVRERSGEALEGSGLSIGYTGDVALFADSEEAFTDAERIVGIATVVLIVGLQLLIFRSPIAALFPIISVGLVFTLAQSLIAAAGKLFDFQVGTELTTLLTVVLFGIGTDYILFLLFRFRERLRAGDEPKAAVATAVERVGQAIASAAGVVIIAFSAMLLASLGFFTTLGPSLAVAVALMLLAALTLIPALLALIGPRVFWPSKSWQRPPKASVFGRLGRLVARRPVLVALVSGAVVVTLAAGTLGFRQNYDFVSQLPSDTESRRAFTDLQSGFPAGALNPTQVFVRGDQPLDQAALAQLGAALQQVEGVGQVQPPQLSPDRRVGQVDLLLTMNPSSAEALDLIEPLRDAAHAAAPPGTTVLVGGTTSATADLRQATGRDLRVIFPVAGILIALVLALLLRSLVAPIYLMLAVMLGYAASLGAAVFIFQGLGGEPGVLFLLPILVYLFVVAIGTDYNILMIARLREEAAEGNDPRTAADLAVEHAGPSVVSAGVILAGTFGSLLLAGVAFLTQMGAAVTVGIVLAAFVISVFLVPAVTALIGTRAWWPSRIDRGGAPAHRPPPHRPPPATGPGRPSRRPRPTRTAPAPRIGPAMAGAGDVVGRRALNRATLARQLLLGRRDLPVVEAVERLAGLNAQDPEPPYLTLWARLAGFERDALTRALEDRSVVRGSLLRGTQHMATAADYLAWRPLLQPVLERSRRTFARATAGIDPDELAATARRLLAERPLTRPALGRLLAERWPGHEPGPLAWSAQCLLPLVHPPPSGTWGVRGPTPFVLAESWLGRPLAAPSSPRNLIERHLAAFGPASVADIQAWCGLTRLRGPVEQLAPDLRRFRDDHGRVLYDLPDAACPDPDTPAPPRFLPYFDNVLLAHADRTRIMTDDHRKRVCVGAVVEPTLLIDGQVVAIWKLVHAPARATLEIQPLEGVAATDLNAATREGELLLRFAAAEAPDHDIRVLGPER